VIGSNETGAEVSHSKTLCIASEAFAGLNSSPQRRRDAELRYGALSQARDCAPELVTLARLYGLNLVLRALTSAATSSWSVDARSSSLILDAAGRGLPALPMQLLRRAPLWGAVPNFGRCGSHLSNASIESEAVLEHRTPKPLVEFFTAEAQSTVGRALLCAPPCTRAKTSGGQRTARPTEFRSGFGKAKPFRKNCKARSRICGTCAARVRLQGSAPYISFRCIFLAILKGRVPHRAIQVFRFCFCSHETAETQKRGEFVVPVLRLHGRHQVFCSGGM